LRFARALKTLAPGVHLSQLRLREFRNYVRLDVDFVPGFHLLLGDNAQGKTNLLEAVYLLATLRSFRGAGGAQMVRHGQKGYFVGGTIRREAEHKIQMYWSMDERRLRLDGSPVRRLSDYLGTFRAVVFSSEDLQLIRGAASRRRRFLDLLLTQTHGTYLPLLQRYAQTVRARNALLKRPLQDEMALEGFTREMIDAGNQIIPFRHQILPHLARVATAAYGRISGGAEELQLEYVPSVKRDFAVELTQSRRRESVLRSTVIGPHRDELALRLNGRLVEEFGSEGQKRSVAIALKMAQAEYLTEIHGSPPVLLIDDIMGELDVRRRSAFVPLLHRVDQAGSQVFMTATEESWPKELGHSLHKWQVRNGELQPWAEFS
jgi:DNA replication and repair protein RecF